ncbi:MAG: PTS cellobiose transporter subunit IIC [Turicibacter sp.]|nr:PTS cellobiose transporter subunit IIC [Turicibacter sp.]
MNLFEKIEQPIMVVGEKLNNNKALRILRDAFMLAFPLTIFGSIMLVIANFPYLDKLLGADGVANLQNALNPASTATMSIATVFVCLGIGYYFSKEEEVDPIFGAAIALTSFLLLTPFEAPIGDTGEMLGGVFHIDRLGAKGMFVGMFASFLSAWIYVKVVKKNLIIKMPPSVPTAVSKSFAALIPAVVTLTVFLLIRIGFSFTSWGNVHDFIYEIIQTPLTNLGKGLAATLIAVFAIQLLWFFGLHGQIIVNSVVDPIWNTLSLENFTAFQSGQELPNVVTKQFMETFTVGLGGTGMTLIVLILILAFMKSRQLKEVGKLALPAGIFNVNEPTIFGLPIVLNPIIAIPWIVAPIIATTVAYFAMATGLVPPTTGVAVPWTTPVFISGTLATNSVMGGLLQLVQMIVVGIVWFPFLKALDKRNVIEEKKFEE